MGWARFWLYGLALLVVAPTGWAETRSRSETETRSTTQTAQSQRSSPGLSQRPATTTTTTAPKPAAQPAIRESAGADAEAEAEAEEEPAAQAEGLTIFDFESGTDEWAIPDWAKESKDYAGKQLTAVKGVASNGKGSIQLMADFPGNRWAGGYVEQLIHVTDWGQFSAISADVYVPANAPKDLMARFILTIGKDWTWTEMNRGIALQPGKWTTIKANLKPGSMDWKFFPDDTFRRDIRKLGIRIESEKTPYTGSVNVDNVRLLK